MSDISLAAWPLDDIGRGQRPAAALSDETPVRRHLFGRVVWGAVKATAATAVLATAAIVSVATLRSLPAQAPEAPAAPPPVWEDIVKPVQVYSLESPLFAGMATTYAARRHMSGGGREDVLARGDIGDGRPALRLAMFRRAAEGRDAAPLFAALVHEAAKLGLSVRHSGLPDLMPTRFGAFEFVDLSLARGDAAAFPCAGFRLALDAPALAITGLACGKGMAAPNKTAVGCLVERLDVAAARDDRDLVDFFAASELRRNAACSGMRLGPDGLHAAWLDDPTPAAAPAPKRPADTSATSRKSLRHRKGFPVTLAGR